MKALELILSLGILGLCLAVIMRGVIYPMGKK